MGGNNVEVAEQDVGGNGCTCLTADSGRCPLQGDAPGAQKSSPRASCSMVAIDVETRPAAAPGRVKKEREADTF